MTFIVVIFGSFWREILLRLSVSILLYKFVDSSSFLQDDAYNPDYSVVLYLVFTGGTGCATVLEASKESSSWSMGITRGG